MTIEDAITDLKQFIVATVSQQMSGFATKDDIANFATKDDLAGLATKDDIVQLEDKLTQKIDDTKVELSQKIDDLQGFIGDAIDTSNNAHHEQLKNHERRIIRLERKLA